jgi:hypothetical protein
MIWYGTPSISMVAASAACEPPKRVCQKRSVMRATRCRSFASWSEKMRPCEGSVETGWRNA